MTQGSDPDGELAELMASSCYYNAYDFVMLAFEWDKGELKGWHGPDAWQKEILILVSNLVRERGFNGVDAVEAIRAAVASGHGIGKSALVAWLILWIMSTRPHCKGVVTANTSTQLESKTWAELDKWTKRCITGHWFSVTHLKMTHRLYPKTWRCDGVTCREENSEAFAGQHAANSTSFYIFDEGSAVPDKIYEVAEGGLTDGEPMMFVFGNPTRNSGKFRSFFGAMKHRWITRQIDSRTAKMPNKKQIEEWINDYGEDSDFVRVRVRGVFPRAGSTQFISTELVEEAMAPGRDAPVGLSDALVLGVDVARFGDDQTVFYARRGLDGRTMRPLKFRGLDTQQIAARIAEFNERFHPDAIFIDNGTFGAGVVDRCRYLHIQVVGIDFGSNPGGDMLTEESGIRYFNKRAEMWGRARDWLKRGMLPDDPDLKVDLTGVEYGYAAKNGHDCILLEKKADMKKRGLASPDVADAFCLTFAQPVGKAPQAWKFGPQDSNHSYDYNPFANIYDRQPR